MSVVPKAVRVWVSTQSVEMVQCGWIERRRHLFSPSFPELWDTLLLPFVSDCKNCQSSKWSLVVIMAAVAALTFNLLMATQKSPIQHQTFSGNFMTVRGSTIDTLWLLLQAWDLLWMTLFQSWPCQMPCDCPEEFSPMHITVSENPHVTIAITIPHDRTHCFFRISAAVNTVRKEFLLYPWSSGQWT